MFCFQLIFVFSDTGLFIAWPHPLFLSIHKNKFQPPEVHRFYAWKNKEISTEWKYKILKIDWKYSITSFSWAEIFSAVNPFLMSGDNRSHIPENTHAAKFSGLYCGSFLLRLISVSPLLFLTNNLTIIHDGNGLSVKGVWIPSVKKVPDTWLTSHFSENCTESSSILI